MLNFDQTIQHNKQQPMYQELLQHYKNIKLGRVDRRVLSGIEKSTKQIQFEDGFIGYYITKQKETNKELYYIPLLKTRVGIRIV